MNKLISDFHRFLGPILNICAGITLENALCLILSLTALLILIRFIFNGLKFQSKKRILTIRKENKTTISRLTERFKKSYFLKKIINNLAVKIGMFNRYSYEKNLEYASFMLILSVITFGGSILLFVPQNSEVWYITAGYVMVTIIFMAILFCIFSFIARQRFTGKMPETYKLLNSRYIITGNILKAISISMDDFDRPVKKEMLKIYDVLKKNNSFDIDLTFKNLEMTYKNEYLTLLLTLIKQAYYKGGNTVIKKQFEDATEDILSEIENRKDLSMTTRTYVLIAIFLPFGMKWLEKFNFTALGEASRDFYSSPFGIELKIGFYFAFLIYLGILLFMERTA